jgi:hypothetical protein
MKTTEKTITGTQIKVSENNSKRTYTIWVNGSKYRTTPMNKIDFNECKHNTANDWAHFLRSNDYYKVR